MTIEPDAHHAARVDLAASFRWFARLGMHESVANHFSLAVSDDGQCFLINLVISITEQRFASIGFR